jgi:hypothetical protein
VQNTVVDREKAKTAGMGGPRTDQDNEELQQNLLARKSGRTIDKRKGKWKEKATAEVKVCLRPPSEGSICRQQNSAEVARLRMPN